MRKSAGKITRLYRVWANMKSRCSDKKTPAYEWYGARGITVCERWLKFENFAADMGEPPSSTHSLDRIDSKGPYAPNNCRWATAREQAENRSKTIWVVLRGERVTLAEANRRLGLSPSAIGQYCRTHGITPQEYIDKKIK
jgi:transcriptional regulator with GAF, ATPase, and Fis domain